MKVWNVSQYQWMLLSGTQFKSSLIKHLHKIFQAGNVHFIFNSLGKKIIQKHKENGYKC